MGCRLETKSLIAFSLVLAILVAHPACDLGWDDGSSGPSDPCELANGHVDPGPDWSIASLSGSGKRTGCTDSDYDKSFQFELSASIPIIKTSETGPPRFSGTLGKTFKVVDGEINGICISFQTEETIPGGEIVRRTFVGKFKEYNEVIKGDFSGLGPYQCGVTGTFRAVLGQ